MERHDTQRPTGERPGPTVAVVFLQPACNMTCTFCVTENDFQAFEFDLAVQLLDELVASGVRTVTFGGGEPFAWRGDVVALAEQAKRRGLFVQVGTNGIALPPGFAGLPSIDRYVLPLESVEPAVHDAMRHQPSAGHHATILARLAELAAAGRSVTLSTVLTAANHTGLQQLAEFLRDYHQVAGNVHAWHLYQFLPLGRGGRRHAAELAIPPATYHAHCAAVKALGLPFQVFKRSDMYASKTVEFFWCEDGSIRSGGRRLHRQHTASRPS